MRTQDIVGFNGKCHQIGPRWLDAHIHMLPKVTVGPTIKAAVLHCGDVIRNQLVAKLIAFIHHRPASLKKMHRGTALNSSNCDCVLTAGFQVDQWPRVQFCFGSPSYMPTETPYKA